MSKTYILQKDWFFSNANDENGTVYKAGEKLTRRSHYQYYEFSNHVLVNEKWVENNPEWFLPEVKEIIGIPEDATDLEVFHIKGNEAFIGFKIPNGNFHFTSVPYNPKPENKSNDSFQWTDELVKSILHCAVGNIKDFVMQPDDFIGDFKISRKPKPQAENKPDWEILEMVNKYGKRHVGILEVGNDWSMYLDKKMWGINKVKRLSDGEVFSVGDYVNDCKCPIAGFNICDNGKRMYVYGEKNSWGQDLPKINKSLPPQPQKLLETEDGIAMVGQQGFVLSTDTWSYSPCKLPADPFKGDHNQFKYFHSGEAAEKYIAENKPKESSCKSPSGNCVNHLACNREDKCIYEAREEVKFPFGKDKSVTLLPNEAVFPNKPDWEIVAYRNKMVQGAYMVIEKDSRQFEMAAKNNFPIHSVKRQDGITFSVGDMVVNASATNLPHDGYAITHFTIIGERIQVAVAGGFFWLDGIIKAKPEESKPDWEIVSFKGKHDYTYSITSNGLYDCDDLPFTDTKSKEVLFQQDYKIHSVKRLSDGEVFCVGDDENHYGKIIAITYDEKYPLPNDVTLHFDGERKCFLKYANKKLPPQPQKEERKAFYSYMESSSGLIKEGDTPVSATINLTKNDLYKKEEQRIEVQRMWDLNNIYQKQHVMIGFKVSLPIPEEKYPAIKQAIEQVLNDDGKSIVQKMEEAWNKFTIKYPGIKDKEIRKAIELLVNSGYVVEHQDKFDKGVITWYHPFYTQQQVDAMCEDIWYAARAKAMASHNIEVYKYDDLEHYKKSKPA